MADPDPGSEDPDKFAEYGSDLFFPLIPEQKLVGWLELKIKLAEPT